MKIRKHADVPVSGQPKTACMSRYAEQPKNACPDI